MKQNKIVRTLRAGRIKIQKGYTLAEIAIALLIIGVLSALVSGGVIVYLAQGNGKAAGEALRLSMVKTKQRLAPTYTNVSLTGVISTGMLDNIKILAVNAARDAVSHKMGSGGAITVAPADSNTTAAFTIPNVPLFSCEEFVQALDAGADSIVVGSVTVKASGVSQADLNFIQCSLTAGTTIVAKAK